MASIRAQIGNYEIIETLGSGSFGKVKLAQHTLTSHRVAMKFISKEKVAQSGVDMLARVEREIQVLRFLRHPHIIKLYEVITTPHDIIMVMEYAGGELFDLISERGRISENDARRFFQQIISAITYCHTHNIVHRDLKPENLLLSQPMFATSSSSSATATVSDTVNVKIADFGLSNTLTDGDFLKTSCGSPNYAAPEVISGKLYAGPEVDIWSCGVILYVMLCGRLPFDDEYIPNLFRKINEGIFTIPSYLSNDAKQILLAMLVVDPLKRITIADIQKHAWFAKGLPIYLKARPPYPTHDLHRSRRRSNTSVNSINGSLSAAALIHISSPDNTTRLLPSPIASNKLNSNNENYNHEEDPLGCNSDTENDIDNDIVQELSNKLGMSVNDIIDHLVMDDQPAYGLNQGFGLTQEILLNHGHKPKRPPRHDQNDVRVAYDLLADSRRLWGKYTGMTRTTNGSNSRDEVLRRPKDKKISSQNIRPIVDFNGFDPLVSETDDIASNRVVTPDNSLLCDDSTGLSAPTQWPGIPETPPAVFSSLKYTPTTEHSTVQVLSHYNGSDNSILDNATANSTMKQTTGIAVQRPKSFKTRSKWHVGIRSRNHPLEVMQEIFKALKQVGMEWKVITPFHVRCRYAYTARKLTTITIIKMDIQLYKVDSNYYLVDFKFIPPKARAALSTSIHPISIPVTTIESICHNEPQAITTSSIQHPSTVKLDSRSPVSSLTATLRANSKTQISSPTTIPSQALHGLNTTKAPIPSSETPNVMHLVSPSSGLTLFHSPATFPPTRYRSNSVKLGIRGGTQTRPDTDQLVDEKVVNVFAFMEVCARLISELACG